MEKNRIIAYSSGFLILVIAAYVYLSYIFMLGFPDGHMTELNRAEKTLFTIFINASIILSSILFWIGCVNSDRNLDRRLRPTLFLYLFLATVTFAIDYYFRLTLPHNMSV